MVVVEVVVEVFVVVLAESIVVLAPAVVDTTHSSFTSTLQRGNWGGQRVKANNDVSVSVDFDRGEEKSEGRGEGRRKGRAEGRAGE